MRNNLVDSVYIPARRSGNTTRLVDTAIQNLFRGETILCLDHNGHNTADTTLMEKILRRLSIEHSIDRDEVVVNFDKKTIKLKLCRE